MTNKTPIKNFYKIDVYLVLCHTVLLALSFALWKIYPHIQTKPDMSGLFFMIISVLGGIIGLIVLAVSLPRLDRTLRHPILYKLFFAFIYWISSSVILVCVGISKFFFNEPLVLIVFVLIFFSSLYLSIIRVADMRKKDWLILIGILAAFIVIFFLPKF